jgi:hypothetical protein
MKRTIFTLLATAAMIHCTILRQVQNPPPPSSPLTERGRIIDDGQSVPYLIHRLPVNAFPQLPRQIAVQLEERGCAIPQTYEAHRPENVVHGSFAAPNTDDWAVLCSVKGTVELLVFLDGADDHPTVLVTAKETERLQRAQGEKDWLGFNWGIDRATPVQVHDAQSGLARRPPAPDHDALADSVIEHRTVYHFYSKGSWTLLDMSN